MARKSKSEATQTRAQAGRQTARSQEARSGQESTRGMKDLLAPARTSQIGRVPMCTDIKYGTRLVAKRP